MSKPLFLLEIGAITQLRLYVICTQRLCYIHSALFLPKHATSLILEWVADMV